jgi:hypothetical protein
MIGVDDTHPDHLHADLNLAQRGYVATERATTFLDLNGDTNADPPQLSGLFADRSPHPLTNVYQVHDWDWGCSDHGCRGDLLPLPEVTLLGIGTTPGEAVRAPSRNAAIFGDGYIAAVLYAEATRLTLSYTRDGSVANGYVVHLEGLCVDPNLLAAYRTANRAGRTHLPALHRDEALGTTTGSEMLVAMRDDGSFQDPRSRKDWWQGMR